MKTTQSNDTSENGKKSKSMKNILAGGLFNTREGTFDSKYLAITVISAISTMILIDASLIGKISTGINILCIMLGSEFIHRMRTKDGKELQLWRKTLMLVLIATGVAFLGKWFDNYMGDALVQNTRNWIGWK